MGGYVYQLEDVNKLDSRLRGNDVQKPKNAELLPIISV